MASEYGSLGFALDRERDIPADTLVKQHTAETTVVVREASGEFGPEAYLVADESDLVDLVAAR